MNATSPVKQGQQQPMYSTPVGKSKPFPDTLPSKTPKHPEAKEVYDRAMLARAKLKFGTARRRKQMGRRRKQTRRRSTRKL